MLASPSSSSWPSLPTPLLWCSGVAAALLTTIGFVRYRRSRSWGSFKCSSEALAKKVYLITGATDGIGKELAKMILKAGAAKVVIAARDEMKAKKVVQELG